MSYLSGFTDARIAFRAELIGLVKVAHEDWNRNRIAKGLDERALDGFLNDAGGESAKRTYYRLLAQLDGKPGPNVKAGAFRNFGATVLKPTPSEDAFKRMLLEFTYNHYRYECPPVTEQAALVSVKYLRACYDEFNDVTPFDKLKGVEEFEEHFLFPQLELRRRNRHKKALHNLYIFLGACAFAELESRCYRGGNLPTETVRALLTEDAPNRGRQILRPYGIDAGALSVLGVISAEINDIGSVYYVTRKLYTERLGGTGLEDTFHSVDVIASKMDAHYDYSVGQWATPNEPELGVLVRANNRLEFMKNTSPKNHNRISAECAYATAYSLYWGEKGLDARNAMLREIPELERQRRSKGLIDVYSLSLAGRIARKRYNGFFECFEATSKSNTRDAMRVEALVSLWISCGHLSLLNEPEMPHGLTVGRCLLESHRLMTKDKLRLHGMWCDWYLLCVRMMKAKKWTDGHFLALTRATELERALGRHSRVKVLEAELNAVFLAEQSQVRRSKEEAYIFAILAATPPSLGT